MNPALILDMEEGEIIKDETSDLKDNTETGKSGPLIQRSVAFDLAEDDEKQAEKHVKIGDVTNVRNSEEKCDTAETAAKSSSAVVVRKDSAGTAVRREIIGILKPPNPRKELKSFPSLPECFLHDLGLIENIALKFVSNLTFLPFFHLIIFCSPLSRIF